MQTDGNLVEYYQSQNVPIWSSDTPYLSYNTPGDPSAPQFVDPYAVMQTDGNL